MNRTVTVFLPVACPGADVVERFRKDPSTWLPSPRPAGAGRWTVRVEGAGMERDVECHVGDPWRTGPSMWRRISWQPLSSSGDVVALERLLPRLHGEIGVVRGDEDTSLVFSARYEVPASLLGAAADGAGLHRVARRTLTRFLSDVRDRILENAGSPV